MSDLNVIQTFSGELEPVSNITGDMMAIDFFLHPLEDSSGNNIIDSNGDLLSDATPGPQTEPLSGELIPIVTITGSIRGI